jgi:hypothetical protein
MTKDKQVTAAMGMRDGDTLTLTNQLASVTIARVVADRASWYELDGENVRRFARAGDALDAALAYLATYERGRCD